MPADRIRALTGRRRIEPTSPGCRRSRRLEPGRGSTYRAGKTVRIDRASSRFALENFSAMLVWNPATLFRLRAAVGPMVGLNLDPSHLIWMGADPIAAARALGGAIHHVHGKDVRLERGPVDVNGVLETRPPVEDVAERAWNYVAVGCGQDLQWR